MRLSDLQTGEKAVIVRVLDEIAPEIAISSHNLKSEYKCGDKIKIPSATFTDNLNGYTSMVYVLTPESCYDFVEQNGEYTFNLKGTYYIVYSVKDADNNVSRERIKVVVK